MTADATWHATWEVGRARGAAGDAHRHTDRTEHSTDETRRDRRHESDGDRGRVCKYHVACRTLHSSKTYKRRFIKRK
jgi:hypothetical protein